MKGRGQFIWDVFSRAPASNLIEQTIFPLALQIITLAGVGILAINGWDVGLKESPQELMTLRKTNLTTLFVWGLWWPGMIALALLGGRLWCTVCPMELINRLADAAVRRTGWPRVSLGRWLKAGWLIVLLYIVLQLLVAGYSIHRVPHYTSLMLLALFGTALVTGLFFQEPRSFCRAFCPAGALLSVYGRYTPLQLDIRDPAVCGRCRTKDCVAQKNRFRFDKRSCPSMIQPFRRRQSDPCVLCFQCAKVCPYDNIGYGWVRRSATSRMHRSLKPFEALFLLIAAGFVAHEVAGEVKWFDAIFHTVPTGLHAWAPPVPFGWFEALWFLLIFPAAIWLISLSVSYLLDERSPWKVVLIAAATGAAPVVAAAHLAKALAKGCSWGGFLPLALAAPTGMENFQRIQTQSLTLPSELIGLPAVGWVMLMTVAALFWRSWSWSKEAVPESLTAARTGLVTATLSVASILMIWPWG
jgi:polyferredoxin